MKSITENLMWSIAVLNLELEDTPEAREILLIAEDRPEPKEYLGGNGLSSQMVAYHDTALTQPTICASPEYYTVHGSTHDDIPDVEANGLFNVRQLSRWKGKYDGKKARAAQLKEHRKLIGVRSTDVRNSRVMSESHIARKKAKRLARLQARHG